MVRATLRIRVVGAGSEALLLHGPLESFSASAPSSQKARIWRVPICALE
jgi:hypothetical protein